MAELQARKEALLAQLSATDEPPPLLHPRMADVYRTKVAELAVALQRSDTRLEASETLRGLIDSIVLSPDAGQLPSRDGDDSRFGEPRLRIELRGNLAAMLTAAQPPSRAYQNTLRAMAGSIGCGGVQPSEFGVCLGGSVAPTCAFSKRARRRRWARVSNAGRRTTAAAPPLRNWGPERPCSHSAYSTGLRSRPVDHRPDAHRTGAVPRVG